MKNHHNRTRGIGIEMEGFIVNSERPQERIAGLSSAEWAIAEFTRRFPLLAGHLSPEQASVMLEIKPDIQTDDQQAIRQLFEIRSLVDQCLEDQGCRLSFQPIAAQPFEFVPADMTPGSRSRKLVEEWSETEAGRSMLFGTATASFQINDSLLRSLRSGESVLDFATRTHNVFTAERMLLMEQNKPLHDWHGRSRLDLATSLLSSVKARQFQARGLPPRHSPLPDHFRTTADFALWSCAHSDVNNIEHADPKNEHAVTVKVKRSPELIIETRIFDSLEDPDRIRQLIRLNTQLLTKI